MGCLQSKAANRASAYAVNGPPERAQKLDPKDYTFKDRKGEVLVKLPGQINGQQFIIDNCEDCDIHLFDHCAAVTIDDCKNCRIFVGPTESSIFIRDSYGCKCAFLCRQFRARDCKLCAIMLLCRTRPIIEGCRQVQFGCYDHNYRGLAEQLAATKLSVFHNFWSHIYDYTPQTGVNFTFLAPSVTVAQLMGSLPDLPASQASGPAAKLSLLNTWGDRPVEGAKRSLLCVLPAAKAAVALEVIETIQQKGGVLLGSNLTKLSKDTVLQLIAKANWPKMHIKALMAGEWISLEFAMSEPGTVTEKVVTMGALVAVDASDAAALLSYAGIEG